MNFQRRPSVEAEETQDRASDHAQRAGDPHDGLNIGGRSSNDRSTTPGVKLAGTSDNHEQEGPQIQDSDGANEKAEQYT